MLKIEIPGFGVLRLEHLVLDYNGTLAVDGALIEGVPQRLIGVSQHLAIHVITADTFGTVRSALSSLPCNVTVLATEDQAAGKLRYVEDLGAGRTACIGNGRNDRLMVKAAALGIIVLQQEGAAVEALNAAHLILPDIVTALDVLLHPLRLVATLRS